MPSLYLLLNKLIDNAVNTTKTLDIDIHIEAIIGLKTTGGIEPLAKTIIMTL